MTELNQGKKVTITDFNRGKSKITDLNRGKTR
jgi:hypothetical protein